MSQLGRALGCALVLGASACPNITVVATSQIITTGSSSGAVTDAGATSLETPSATPTVEPPGPFWTTQRIAGASVGGAGLAGVIVGAIFGGGAIAKTKAANCTDANVCQTEADATLRRNAQTWGTASNATFIPGCALLAVGAVLLLVPSRAPAAQKRIGLTISPGGLGIRGDL